MGLVLGQQGRGLRCGRSTPSEEAAVLGRHYIIVRNSTRCAVQMPRTASIPRDTRSISRRLIRPARGAVGPIRRVPEIATSLVPPLWEWGVRWSRPSRPRRSHQQRIPGLFSSLCGSLLPYSVSTVCASVPLSRTPGPLDPWFLAGLPGSQELSSLITLPVPGPLILKFFFPSIQWRRSGDGGGRLPQDCDDCDRQRIWLSAPSGERSRVPAELDPRIAFKPGIGLTINYVHYRGFHRDPGSCGPNSVLKEPTSIVVAWKKLFSSRMPLAACRPHVVQYNNARPRACESIGRRLTG